MAVSIITLLPVLVVFFLSQRLFVQGVTLTGMGGR
jgi:ABC-type glycerol-3-phosphate transport system permease component